MHTENDDEVFGHLAEGGEQKLFFASPVHIDCIVPKIFTAEEGPLKGVQSGHCSEISLLTLGIFFYVTLLFLLPLLLFVLFKLDSVVSSD